MRFAYADPPYPGQAARYYADHPDYGGEVDHGELIAKLEAEYPDGWLLSTCAKELPVVLALCPLGEPNAERPGTTRERSGVRVLSWVKPMNNFFPGVHPTYSWEPVILRGGRRDTVPGGLSVIDHLSASIESYTFREKPAGHVTGAKPAVFYDWIFRCIGARAEDDFTDLFPGSGNAERAWATFCNQPEIPPSLRREPRRNRRYRADQIGLDV